MGTEDHLHSNLPEVAQRNDFPIAVPRDEEGMQAVPQSWDQGQPYQNIIHDSNVSAPQDVTAEQAGGHSKFKMSRRSGIVLGVVLAIAIILAVGIGVGLGVGLKSGSNKSTNTDAQSQSQSQSRTASAASLGPTTSIATTSTSSPASPTCSGVTSGQTGIACVSCNQTSSDSGGYVADTGSSRTKFHELCFVDMPDGSAVYNKTTNEASTTRSLTDIEAIISYSFTDCMTQCARYNQQYGTASMKYPCKAVTYGANITAAIEEQGSRGNCYLKDARGFGIFDSSGLVMSGYINI